MGDLDPPLSADKLVFIGCPYGPGVCSMPQGILRGAGAGLPFPSRAPEVKKGKSLSRV